jgi:hypothetical protein
MHTIIYKKYICAYNIFSFKCYFTMVQEKEKKEKENRYSGKPNSAQIAQLFVAADRRSDGSDHVCSVYNALPIETLPPTALHTVPNPATRCAGVVHLSIPPPPPPPADLLAPTVSTLTSHKSSLSSA